MPETSQPKATTIANEDPVAEQENRSAVLTAPIPTPVMEEQTPNLEVIRSEAKKAEKDRVASISALGAQHSMGDLARQLIDGDNSLDEARAAFLEKKSELLKWNSQFAPPMSHLTTLVFLKPKSKTSVLFAL